VRMTLFVLLPLAAVLALLLVVEGVPQTLAAGVTTHALDGGAEQTIALGPIERLIDRLAGVKADREMGGKA